MILRGYSRYRSWGRSAPSGDGARAAPSGIHHEQQDIGLARARQAGSWHSRWRVLWVFSSASRLEPHTRRRPWPGPARSRTVAPPGVTADALPTVQVNGVVWTQFVVGNTVYAGGQFSTARPSGAAPGKSTVRRSNLLAFDIRSGKLIAAFAPDGQRRRSGPGGVAGQEDPLCRRCVHHGERREAAPVRRCRDVGRCPAGTWPRRSTSRSERSRRPVPRSTSAASSTGSARPGPAGWRQSAARTGSCGPGSPPPTGRLRHDVHAGSGRSLAGGGLLQDRRATACGMSRLGLGTGRGAQLVDQHSGRRTVAVAPPS